MATLNKIKSETELVFKIIGVVIAILLLLGIGGLIRNQLFPPAEKLPTALFGKLPQIAFPVNSQVNNFSYTIDTLTGSLPVLPNQTNVYKISPIKPDLLAFDRTKDMVYNIGFQSSVSAALASENIYEWKNSNSDKIALNIFSDDFTLTSSYLSTSSQLIEINEEEATATVNSFLQNLNLLPDDIDNQKTIVAFLYKKNGSLIPVSGLSDASDIRVDLFQSDVNGIPIYYPNANESTMNFMVETVNGKPKIVQANFIHQEITKESATYPIKSADLAFEELKEGKAYLVSGNNQNVLIKNVFLAYYLGEERQGYLMPVIVFQGNNGFLAYVPAVTDAFLSN